MSCLNVMSTGALETGSIHDALENSTRSGSARENAPLVMRPGSDTLNVASPAVLITFAVVVASYSFATPGVNAGKEAVPTFRLSVAGTVPAAPPPTPPPSTASVNSGSTKLLRPNVATIRRLPSPDSLRSRTGAFGRPTLILYQYRSPSLRSKTPTSVPAKSTLPFGSYSSISTGPLGMLCETFCQLAPPSL